MLVHRAGGAHNAGGDTITTRQVIAHQNDHYQDFQCFVISDLGFESGLAWADARLYRHQRAAFRFGPDKRKDIMRPSSRHEECRDRTNLKVR